MSKKEGAAAPPPSPPPPPPSSPSSPSQGEETEATKEEEEEKLPLIGTGTSFRKEPDSLPPHFFPFVGGKTYYMFELGLTGGDPIMAQCTGVRGHHCENGATLYVVLQMDRDPTLEDGLAIKSLQEAQDGWAVETLQRVPSDVKFIVETLMW